MNINSRSILEAGNSNITALVIRSIYFNAINNRFMTDFSRLTDELQFYKFLKVDKTPSMISALIPIIYVNSNIYSAYEEAVSLFTFIRKKISPEEQFGIYLLSIFLKRKKVETEDIILFSIEGLEKKDQISLQKIKVSSIMNINDPIKLINNCLNENFQLEIIFDCKLEYEINNYKDILSEYLNNLVENKYPKRYNKTNGFDVLTCFEYELNEIINCPLFSGKIVSKIITDDRVQIEIKTKNTLYRLSKSR